MISGVFESLGFRLSINCYIVSGLRPGIIPLPLPGAQGMGPNIRLLSYVSEIVIECDRRADVQAEREVPVGYFVVAVLFDNGGLRTGRTPRKRSGNEQVAAFLCT